MEERHRTGSGGGVHGFHALSPNLRMFTDSGALPTPSSRFCGGFITQASMMKALAVD